jgi:hypothetical protein
MTRGQWRFRLRPRPKEGISLQETLAVLELFFGSFSEELTFRERSGHFLSVCFGLTGGALIAIGLLKVAPWILAWNYKNGDLARDIFFVPLNALWWGIRAALLFCLPTAAILKLLWDFPASRWVACPVIAFLSLWFFDQSFSLREKHASSRTEIAAADEAEQGRLERERLAASQEREHEQLARRRNELAEQVDVQWRADVESAGASGKPGAIPPMLKVIPMRQRAQVSNLTDKPLYLRLSRVATSADGRIERCEFDGGNTVTIGPHDSHRFQMFLSGNSPGCMNASLEFRVGTANDPEPSWWSQTALQDYMPKSPSYESALEKSTDTLTAEVAELERRLADSGRAERWRSTLGAAR